jgi:hypothetical protein
VSLVHDFETAENNKRRAKTAAAIGLSVVFVAVVGVQIANYWPDAKPTDGTQSYGSAADRADADRSGFPQSNRLADGAAEPTAKWPRVPLSECTRYDPFATPGGFIIKKETAVQEEGDGEALRREMEIAQKRAEQERVISGLRDAGVNAVFNGSRQSSAIIGSRMVRVGEEVEGFRVLAIEPDGIVIERPTIQ